MIFNQSAENAIVGINDKEKVEYIEQELKEK